VNLANIRTGIAAWLSDLPGLHGYPYFSDNPAAPAAMVMGPERIEYDVDLSGGHQLNIAIRLLAQRASVEQAQATIDLYLSSGTAESIRDACRADPTLGGTVDAAKISYTREYGGAMQNSIAYAGVEVVLEAMT